LQNIQAFRGSRARLKTGKVKRLTNLTAKSKNSGHAARRGVRGRASKPLAASALSRSARRNAELERELAETRDYLKAMQEQHEAANQELQASNEEVQSANEELQSTNEELETAKEELESSNDELTTVNEEMAKRNAELKRTEREIKSGRDYAEATIRTARDPLVVLRADLKVDKANDAFYRTFKVTPQETENVLIYELDHGQWDIPKLRQLLEEIIPRNNFFNDFEVTHDFVHIGHHTMLLNARRLDGASGATQRILLGIEDITERRRGEEALRESEERYRTLFNLVPVAVYSVDTSGVIQNFNGRAAELWGRQPAVGSTDERFCGSFKAFRPDGSYMPHDQCPMAEVVSGQISEVRDAEAVIERPDGSRVTVVINIRQLKNDRGEVTGAINCFYDISGRKQAEQTLRESERRYHSLFESIDEGFCVIEVLFDSQKRAIDFVYVETNPAFEKQTGLHGAQGRRVLELAPALERHWFETYGRVALTGEPVRFQDRAEVLGRWFDVYAFRVEAPELRRVAVLFTDITRQREAQDALHGAQVQLADHAVQLEQLVTDRTAKLQETIGELEHFSYTITHDMRAPLRAMKGFGGELLRESGSRLPPASADYLRRIMDAAERMDALIRDALQYTRIVRGDIPLTPVEPTLVLHGILESYPSLQPPHVDIQIVEPLPTVIANEAGLGQCFSNLLANAVKFIKPGVTPQIRIWAERHQNAPEEPADASIHQGSPAAVIRFWFEDNGIGVPREYQERIFDMFQQLDKSYEGTGIGLALVRKTVERMKGKVGVESASDKGSRFWLELQRADPIIPQSNNRAAA
jgi:PAS domain S-box-containing protein